MRIKQNLIRLIVFFRMFKQWKKLAARVRMIDYKKSAKPCLVIVPCDPWAVGGSRGDEAMFTGVIHHYRQLFPEIPIYIVCSDDNGANYIRKQPFYNITPIISWNGPYPIERIYNSIIAVRPTDVVVLGADCMDGYYSPELSLSLLALHDLCTKTPGIKSRLLGFSFNEHPSWMVVKAFKSITSEVIICLRDNVSLSRYKQSVNRDALLVADAAFMLEAQSDFPLYNKVASWVNEQRERSNIIIGINYHPMLRVYRDAEDIKSDARRLAKNIESILLQQEHVSFVFIPHDDRSRLTDNLMLASMYDSLQSYKQRIFYSSEVPSASRLKAICGLLDGLVSSRMHLAIAALGKGIPVMAATYQGKFEGLFQHFGLENKFLLTPQELLSDNMVLSFKMFLESLPTLKKQIRERLPHVLELSKRNLLDE